MNDHPAIIFAAAMLFIFGLFSKLSDRSIFTAPMFFVLMGIVVGPLGLNLFSLHINNELIHILTEVTLIIILFIDASTINLKQLIQNKEIPRNLLLIGLPLTMLLGTVVAYFLFPDTNIYLLILMALILSPTDAALGQAVVKSSVVPLKVRRWISVESGFNDGIALPPIFACIALLSLETASTEHHWALFLIQQILFGAVIGAGVGYIGGYLIEKFSKMNYMNHTFQQLASISLAILCFALAEMIHGNGFIAAFTGGLFLGLGTKTQLIKERIQEFGEAEGQMLILFVFLIFSMTMVPIAVEYWDTKAVIYSLLSLTVIRMIPVALSLMRQKINFGTILFIGWFGPRGIASVLYLLIVAKTIGVQGNEYILSIIVLTILLSVFLHGLTAVPFSKWYGKQHN